MNGCPWKEETWKCLSTWRIEEWLGERWKEVFNYCFIIVVRSSWKIEWIKFLTFPSAPPSNTYSIHIEEFLNFSFKGMMRINYDLRFFQSILAATKKKISSAKEQFHALLIREERWNCPNNAIQIFPLKPCVRSSFYFLKISLCDDRYP